MANIKPLVDYLKINRRSREAEKAAENITTVYVLDDIYFGVEDDINVLEVSKDKFNNGTDYIGLDIDNNEALYLEVLNTNNEPDSLIYYERRETATPDEFEYRKLTSNTWELLDGSSFITLPLTEPEDVYYYNGNPDVNRVVVSNSLRPVFVFPDTFFYTPGEIANITNGTYELDYQDHEGYDNGVFDSILKLALDSFLKNYLDGRKRKIEVSLVTNEEAKGFVYLFPVIDFYDNKYRLRYMYEPKDQLPFGMRYLSSAITLKFNFVGALLEFLNQTVFYDGDFDSFKNEKSLRQKFLDNYASQINLEVRLARRNIDRLLILLYYTPKIFLEQLSNYTLWDIVGRALEDNLTNIGTNKEDIVLTLLDALYRKSKLPYIFLTELLIRKTSDNESYFYALFNKMNTDNFTKYNDFLKAVWLQSSYVNLDEEVYQEKVEGKDELLYDGPLMLPYKSDKTLGIYHSNTDIDWVDNYSRFKVVVETGKYVYEEVYSPFEKGNVLRKKEIKVTSHYHPFQPIFLKDVDNQKTALKLDRVMPAFYLKAVEAKKTVSNIYTSLEYTADVLTTISGVGNIAKFRHLSKLSKLVKVTKGVKNANKVAKSANIVAKIKLAAGIVEITSGTVNALIKLSGTDSEFSKALQKYLFFLEMLTLTGELTVAIKGGLKKYAREALAQSDDAIRKTYPDVFKQLDEVVEKGLKNSAKLAKRKARTAKKGDINKSFFENVGSKVKIEETTDLISGQTKDYTCVANSLRMVLSDVGVAEFEESLAIALKTDRYGAAISDIPNAIKSLEIDGLSLINRAAKTDKNINFNTLEKLIKSGNKKAVVSVRTIDLGAHAVVVDKIENGRVFVRDPLPLNAGSYYSIDVKDFETVFNNKFVTIKVN